jgi:hypothetical protein
MTIRKKGRFADKGKAILGDKKPSALGEILDDTPSPFPEEKEQSKKQTAKQRQTAPKKTQVPGTTEAKSISEKNTRKTGNTVVRKTVNPSPNELPPKREEFRLPGLLAERLRVYVFDVRAKKTQVVIEALDEYLTKKGY